MKYLITTPGQEPFLTDYYTTENCYSEGMTVYNLSSRKYTTDGVTWLEIQEDHL